MMSANFRLANLVVIICVLLFVCVIDLNVYAQDTDTPTFTPTPTLTSTATASATSTAIPSPTNTLTATNTPIPTSTNTVGVTVVVVTATSSITPFVVTQVVTQPVIITVPPVIIQPTAAPIVVLTATVQPPQIPTLGGNGQPQGNGDGPSSVESEDQYGWYITQSEDLIRTIGAWSVVRDSRANAGAKSVSSTADATLTFAFEGTGVMLVYEVTEVGAPFQLRLDGEILEPIINTAATDERAMDFYALGPYFVEDGYHVLDVVSLMPESGLANLVIDHVARFVGPPRPYLEQDSGQITRDPLVQPNGQNGNITPGPASLPVLSYSLQSRPPTQIPSPTPLAQSVLTIEVLVAYDDNHNERSDFNEGVSGLSIRVVDQATNRILASGVSNQQGIVQLQVTTLRSVNVVIPSLRRIFTVSPIPGASTTHPFEVLLPAGNVPPIIP